MTAIVRNIGGCLSSIHNHSPHHIICGVVRPSKLLLVCHTQVDSSVQQNVLPPVGVNISRWSCTPEGMVSTPEVTFLHISSRTSQSCDTLASGQSWPYGPPSVLQPPWCDHVSWRLWWYEGYRQFMNCHLVLAGITETFCIHSQYLHLGLWSRLSRSPYINVNHSVESLPAVSPDVQHCRVSISPSWNPVFQQGNFGVWCAQTRTDWKCNLPFPKYALFTVGAGLILSYGTNKLSSLGKLTVFHWLVHGPSQSRTLTDLRTIGIWSLLLYLIRLCGSARIYHKSLRNLIECCHSNMEMDKYCGCHQWRPSRGNIQQILPHSAEDATVKGHT